MCLAIDGGVGVRYSRSSGLPAHDSAGGAGHLAQGPRHLEGDRMERYRSVKLWLCANCGDDTDSLGGPSALSPAKTARQDAPGTTIITPDDPQHWVILWPDVGLTLAPRQWIYDERD